MLSAVHPSKRKILVEGLLLSLSLAGMSAAREAGPTSAESAVEIPMRPSETVLPELPSREKTAPRPLGTITIREPLAIPWKEEWLNREVEIDTGGRTVAADRSSVGPQQSATACWVA